MKESTPIKKLEKPFSPLLFVSIVLLTFVVYAAIVWWLFPTSFQINSAKWWLYDSVVFIVMCLVTANIEGFFHVLCLHFPLFVWLQSLFEKHHIIHHSKLTPVKAVPIEGNSIYVKVDNQYYIVEPEQHEASAFPLWTGAVFLIVIGLCLLPLQVWVFPKLPILFAGGAAVMFGLVCYEIIHAMFHKPIKWWYTKLNHPTFGGFWTRIYGHHLMHHVNHKTNYNVFGFFTIPIFDWAFGTLVPNRKLFLHGSTVFGSDFKAPQPYWTLRSILWIARGLCQIDRKFWHMILPG